MSRNSDAVLRRLNKQKCSSIDWARASSRTQRGNLPQKSCSFFPQGGHDRPCVPPDRVPADRVGNGYHPFRGKNRHSSRPSSRAQRGNLLQMSFAAFRRGGHDRPRVPSDRVPVDRVGNGYHPFRGKNRLPARSSSRAQARRSPSDAVCRFPQGWA